MRFSPAVRVLFPLNGNISADGEAELHCAISLHVCCISLCCVINIIPRRFTEFLKLLLL